MPTAITRHNSFANISKLEMIEPCDEIGVFTYVYQLSVFITSGYHNKHVFN